MVVDDVRDYEAEDGLDAGYPPQAFPERGGRVDAGEEVVPVDALMRISIQTESDATRGITAEQNIRGFCLMSAAIRLVEIGSYVRACWPSIEGGSWATLR
jgi:hypothetical protein